MSMRSQIFFIATAGVALVACGAVPVPEEFTYRLPVPRAREYAVTVAGVLRVADVDVVSELAGDRLVVADEGARLRAWRHHRWAGPLERVVEDAMVTGLARSRRFLEVKSPSSAGLEDLVLTGRVIDFHQIAAPESWRARATIEVRLSRADGQLVFQDEFCAETPLAANDPDGLARALGTSMNAIVDALIERCDRANLFTLAAPPR